MGDRRLVLLSSKAATSSFSAAFQKGDVLLFGKESAGVPANVAADCALGVRIPIRREVRSLNLATAAAIAALMKSASERPDREAASARSALSSAER